MSNPTLSVELPMAAHGLTHRFEAKTALDDVTFELPRGHILGLVGRNGAGKTTLINALVGLLQPDAGSATVFGEPALKLSDAAKKRLSYVPQQPDALSWLSAKDMLDYIGRFYDRWDADFARKTLKRWDIDARQALSKLSPGERQRVAIVRALASQPDLMVLDEPAAALDPVVRRELLREVAARAAETETTVLLSSHIVSDIERIASDVAFLLKGRLVLNAQTDEIRENYARLWLPADSDCRLPANALSEHKTFDGATRAIVARDAHGEWPAAAHAPGSRLDTLGLEDLFVEIAE